MTQVVHPVLGISWPDGECPKRCSKCSADMDWESGVPLMMFGPRLDGHQTMWIYCERCLPEMAERILSTRKAAP
jgi:hypothetical protein